MSSHASFIPFPPKLELDGNASSNWKKFCRVWENYEIASGLNEKELKLRTATFLTCVGPEALDVYDGFAFDSDADKQNIDKIIQKFEIFCVGKTNETFERYNFNMCKQNENDKFDAYVSKLRKLANTCNYGTLQDSLIRDRIVCGITDNTCRKRLLQEETLTLEKCINICRAVESTSLRLKSMTGDLNTNDIQAEIQVIHNKAKQVGKLGCKYCGMNCVRGKCPAFGKKCNECGKLNHFASQCKQKLYKARNQNVKQLSTHSEYLSLSEEEVMSVTSIEVANKIHAKMRLSEENKIVKFQLDSGATANLIPKSLVKHSTIEKANSILTMYNDTKLKSCGTSMIKMTNPKTNKRYRVKFIIINEEFTPILGAKAIQVMNLIEVKYENILKCVNIPNTWTEQDIRSEYADVFEGEGTFHTPLKLEIDEAVSPVKSPLRRIPIALKPELRKELDRLQQMRIIEPVDTPTDWVSSLVIVKKPSGKIRLCIDPKPLNKALKRCHYPLPIIEDLLPELSRAKVFSKCDVKNGFWHVKLTEKSSYLTTFETPFGRYRWLKMPFGIAPAPENMADLSVLIEKRRLARSRFTKWQKLVEACQSEADSLILNKEESTKEREQSIRVANSSFSSIELIYTELTEIQKEIDYHPDNEKRLINIDEDDGETSYIRAYIKIKAKHNRFECFLKRVNKRWDGERIKEEIIGKKSNFPVTFDVLLEKIQDALQVTRSTESLPGTKTDNNKTTRVNYREYSKPSVYSLNVAKKEVVVTNESNVKCIFCGETDHESYACPEVKEMSVQGRCERVKTIGACFNCLKKGHYVSVCSSSHCKICKKNHHTLLHIEKYEPGRTESTYRNNRDKIESSAGIVKTVRGPHKILMQTSVAKLESKCAITNGRILFDSGEENVV
ncbi:hypothetical protein GQR58_021516 [Nymphon striatum]|nr:hypothetical protein GQR58_021516 [Nymphon striatum]